MSEADRERELETIRSTYRRYRAEGRARLWDPMNRGYARMMRDRNTALIDLVRRSLPPTGGRVLDLGAGDGRLAEVVQRAGIPVRRWIGVDLDPGAMAVAAEAIPWAEFLEASADRLPFEDAAFDLAVTSTLFSSLQNRELEHGAATEVSRVLKPGGWLVWYDLRYDNPKNPRIHGVTATYLADLFPGWRRELRSITLIPPVARRLGWLTPVAYPLLEVIPILRSHLVGRLERPPSS